MQRYLRMKNQASEKIYRKPAGENSTPKLRITTELNRLNLKSTNHNPIVYH